MRHAGNKLMGVACRAANLVIQGFEAGNKGDVFDKKTKTWTDLMPAALVGMYSCLPVSLFPRPLSSA